MKSFTWIVLIVVIAGGLLYFSNRADNEGGMSTTEQGQNQSSDEVGDNETTDLPRAMEIKDNALAVRAHLTAVDGSDSEGVGYKLLADKYYVHYVEAVMPDPAEGSVYEGWLVQPDPLNFFSTGIMQKGEDGKWHLEYVEEGEFPTHTRVVITEETVVDATPEKHIIEGDFN